MFQKVLQGILQNVFKMFQLTNLLRRFRDGENGARFDQASVVSRGEQLNTIVDKMDVLLERRLEEGKHDVDLSAGLRWAGWKKETEFDDALEFSMFNFNNGIEPDSISAMHYGITGYGKE